MLGCQEAENIGIFRPSQNRDLSGQALDTAMRKACLTLVGTFASETRESISLVICVAVGILAAFDAPAPRRINFDVSDM